MRILGFGNVDFDAMGVRCGIPAGTIPIASVQHTMVRRVGAASAFGSATIPERILPVEFIVNDLEASGQASLQNAFTALIAQLEPINPTPRQIRAIRNDGTHVITSGVIQFLPGTSQAGAAVNVISAQFILTDPLWHATTETVQTRALAEPMDLGLRLSTVGGGELPVSVRLAATSQRVTQSATLGWTLRRVYTITNGADEPLLNYPLFINLGNTAALVSASKALSTGNDLRVRVEGREVPRTLRNWNAASNSGFWFIVPNLPAGLSLEVDVVYGNPSAGAPTVLTAMVDMPPFDLAASTNEASVYRTDDTAGNAGKGAWGINGGGTSPPSQVRFDLPGAWRRAMTLPFPGNIDHVTQNRHTPYEASGTKYNAIFAALRASVISGFALPENRSGDGVVLRNPLGITKINVGFLVTNLLENTNPAIRLGKLVVGGRNGSTDAWTKLLDYNAAALTPTSVAAADYQPAAPMKEIMCAVWPFRESVIYPEARPDRYILAQWNTDLTVTIDTTDLGITESEAEHEIYDWSGRVIAYEDGRQRLYRAVTFGAGAAKLATPLDDVLRIVPATRTIEHWNPDLTVLQRLVSPSAYAVVQGIFNQQGAVVEVAGDAWPGVVVQPNGLSNFSFASGLVPPWIKQSVPGTYTMADLVIDAGRLKAEVTASTAGAGTSVHLVADEFLVLNGRRHLWVGADLETTNANLRPRLYLRWFGAAGNLLSQDQEAAYTTEANQQYRRIKGFVPPAGATQFKVGLMIESVTANQIGTVWIDNVWPYGAEVVYEDAGRGDVTLGAGFLESFP